MSSKLEISYSPYLGKTRFLYNGQAITSRDSRFSATSAWSSNRRLQEWVDQLPEAIAEEINDDDITVTFTGFEADFVDVEEALRKQHEKLGFQYKLEFVQAPKIDDINKQINDIFIKFNDGPFAELNSGELKQAYDELNSNNFFVYVLATMSAGKSTLLNSMMQQELLPSASLATTAKTSWIYDSDTLKNFHGTALSEDGKVVVPYTIVDLKTLTAWNQDANINAVRLVGNLPFVEDETQRLVLVDTPGPNNSQDNRHREQTERIISNSPKALVIYVLNARQLGTDDDDKLLNLVAESMRGSKAARDRFIFVLNQMDGIEDDEVSAVIKNARSYLAKHGIASPRIFPVSAKNAIDIRTVLAGKTSLDGYERKTKEREVADNAIKLVDSDGAFFLNDYVDAVHPVKAEIDARLAKAKADKNEVAAAEIYTGVPSLEEAIEFFVEKYAIPAKVRNLVDTLDKALDKSEVVANVKKILPSMKINGLNSNGILLSYNPNLIAAT